MTTSSSGGTPGMLLKGKSLDASLLMMVLSMQQTRSGAERNLREYKAV